MSVVGVGQFHIFGNYADKQCSLRVSEGVGNRDD